MLLPPGTLRAGSPEATAVSAAWTGSYEAAERALRDCSSPAFAAWMQAYLSGARGDLHEAASLGEQVARSRAERAIRVAAAITAGAALRQRRRYAASERLDRLALQSAAEPSERANALIGLAADAVGRADAEACGAMLAHAAAANAPDGRTAVRLAWVRCEHALLRGEPREAAGGARDALSHATASGARRHTAKSLLFLAAALRTGGDRTWRGHAADAERLAAAIGARGVAGAARDLLAQG